VPLRFCTHQSPTQDLPPSNGTPYPLTSTFLHLAYRRTQPLARRSSHRAQSPRWKNEVVGHGQKANPTHPPTLDLRHLRALPQPKFRWDRLRGARCCWWEVQRSISECGRGGGERDPSREDEEIESAVRLGWERFRWPRGSMDVLEVLDGTDDADVSALLTSTRQIPSVQDVISILAFCPWEIGIIGELKP
jgi:hypothetical protein